MQRSINERIKLMRMYLGYTQEEMAEKIGVSDRQYRRYENNKSSIGLQSMIRASQIDDKFSANYLMLGYVDEDIMITAGYNKMPDEEYKKLIQEYQTSSASNRISVLLNKFAKYGKEHMLDASVRDIPMSDVMTRIFEERIKEEIESR